MQRAEPFWGRTSPYRRRSSTQRRLGQRHAAKRSGDEVRGSPCRGPQRPTPNIGDWQRGSQHRGLRRPAPNMGWMEWRGRRGSWRAGYRSRPAPRWPPSLQGPLRLAKRSSTFVVIRKRDSEVSAYRCGGQSCHGTDPDSFGPEIRYLPSGAWILGLGHLGQAYCWCLGCLPYVDPHELLLYLVDFDVVEDANQSTGLLVDQGSVGQTKARAVALALERIGVQTRVSERPFDSHTQRTADEPYPCPRGI